MLTFQDFEKATDRESFISTAINEHVHSEEYLTAKSADLYDHQKNETVCNYIRLIFNTIGTPIEETKEVLGKRFDNDLKELVYYGLIHGTSYGYWTVDSEKGNRLYVFKLTEF